VRRTAAPLRFLIVTLGLWTAARLMLMPGPVTSNPAEQRAEPAPTPPRRACDRDRPVPSAVASAGGERIVPPLPSLRFPSPHALRERLARADVPSHRAAAPARSESSPAEETRAPAANPFLPPPPPPGTRAAGSRWSADAYLFVRGGGRPSLAAAGQLGGSQVAARVAYALNGEGPPRLAVAARVYAPLDDRRASEGALGIDWHPLPGAALRLSAERRFDIGGHGRDAWSAYAAGGFYKGGLPGGIEADGYAQAGVVGTRRRDLFVDGALRLARPVALDPARTLRLGLGAWGAAQPGAARFDVGPRAAISLPLGPAQVTGAIDWRLRVAGDARPGSGAAFTLSSDF